jgi:hypothetical protein
MTLIGTILTELWSLFVDDGSLVIAVILWVLADAIALRNHLIDPAVAAVLLSIGIAVLLAETVLRWARKHRQGS